MGQILDRYDTGGGSKVDKIIKKEYSVFLNLAGLYMPVRDGQWIWSFIRFVVYLVILSYFCWLFCITAALTTSDFNLAAQSVQYATIALLALIMLIFTIYNRKKLNIIHNICADSFHTYESGEPVKTLDELKYTIKHNKRIVLVIINMFFISIALAVIGGPYIDKLLGYSYNNPMKNIDTRLPVKIWHPHSKESTTTLIIFLLLEIVFSGIIALLVAGADIATIFIALSIVLQLNLFHSSIKLINERAVQYHEIHKIKKKNNADNKKRNTLDASKLECKVCAQRCVKDIVEHHLVIMKVIETAQQIISVPTGAALILGIIKIAVSLFALIMGSTTPSSYLVSFLMLVGEIGNIAMLCYFGQKIKDQSLQIQDDLFATDWILFPKEVTSSMSIMMERLKRPLILMAGGFAPLTYETFSSIMNASYNLFKVLVLAKDGRLTIITNRIKNRKYIEG